MGWYSQCLKHHKQNLNISVHHYNALSAASQSLLEKLYYSSILCLYMPIVNTPSAFANFLWQSILLSYWAS